MKSRNVVVNTRNANTTLTFDASTQTFTHSGYKFRSIPEKCPNCGGSVIVNYEKKFVACENDCEDDKPYSLICK